MSQIIHVSAEEFSRVVMQSELPVLVDFYADWCAPCRMMGPLLERVAAQVAGQGTVVMVNVDNEPDLAAAFNVSSIPALVMIHRGKVVDGAVGMTPPDRLVKMFEKVAPATLATTAK